MPPQLIAAIDFETVPDFNQIPALVGEDLPDDHTARLARLEQYMKENGQEENFFPPLALHRIIVPSILLAHIQYRDQFEYSYIAYNLSSMFSHNDAETLNTLIPWFTDKRPRFVTFNGRSFELPLMKLRCLYHGIPCGFFWLVGDKYDNYESRYQTSWHADMMDIVAGHGAARYQKLREVVTAARLPGKIFGNGRNVLQMYLENRIPEIQAYCEMDTLETFLLYVRWQFIRCIIPPEGYRDTIVSVLKLLKAGSEKAHFMKFYTEWCKSDPQVSEWAQTLVDSGT